MASTSSTKPGSSFGQSLQFITSIKLQELEKQRLAYQEHAKIIEEANAAGLKGDIIKKVELLAKAVKSWTGSGVLTGNRIVGGELQLGNLEFWLQQAKKDPSFSREIAERWAKTLEEHIQHTTMRFDAAKLFGNLFNEWLASGDSSAVSYHGADDEELGSDAGATDASYEYVEVGRKEMHEQKAKLVSIVFEDHPVDVQQLKAYLEELFKPEESEKALERLRKEIKDHGHWLRRKKITTRDVEETIAGLLASGLMDEEKRTTLKAFEENPTVLDEVGSVLNMRLAGFESWAWPKEGILVEMRRHLNGKYRAFTDPEVIDALLLHYIGVSWQVKFKSALKRLFDSKAWARTSTPPNHKVKERWTAQLRADDGTRSIDAQRDEFRKRNFFLSQLHDHSSRPSAYDDLVDAPAGQQQDASPAANKQKLLHIMTAECHLNKALHGTHATIRSDLEWFGPSLPHASILTVLEFLGLPKRWLSFFKAFLEAPLRFVGEPEVRVRKRGTPISYSLSVICGEAILFIMDYAVNQRANGLYLYRMHDDLWLWDADAKKCAIGWAEMIKYASLVGLKFNEKKTGSAYIDPAADGEDTGLPAGDIRWGFLKFDPSASRFVLDQKDVDTHIAELRRQLTATKSIFGWVNAYNKYMAFILRNFGGTPANCFGQAHVVDMIDTLARIQRELFPGGADGGGAIGYLKKTLEDRFGIKDLPEGYFYFPISTGGLELRNTMLELLALERRDKPLATYTIESKARKEEKVERMDIDEEGDGDDSDTDSTCSHDSRVSWDSEDDYFDDEKVVAEEVFTKRMEHDRKDYAKLKEVWDLDSDNRRARNYLLTPESDQFMPFDEYISLRSAWLSSWGGSYSNMLLSPSIRGVVLVPKVRASMENAYAGQNWDRMTWYDKWVVSMYGEDVIKKFGGLEAVDPNLIPIGMVQLFRTSRMKLDQ